MKASSLSGGMAFTLLALSSCLAMAQTTVDFEGLPGMTFFAGSPIPDDVHLSNQLVTTYGVVFRSENADYVPVINLGVGHATSGSKGIGAATANNILAYSQPTHISFFLPSDPSVPAATDFVSVRNDNWVSGNGHVAIEVYDVDGVLLATNAAIDNGPFTLSVSAPGIHSVRLIQDQDNVAFDDLKFNALVEADPNEAPIADASATVALVLAPFDCNNSSAATVILDGSNSSDPDGDSLEYAWFVTGDTNVLAMGVQASVDLPVGTHQLTLVVDDGSLSGAQEFTVEVIDAGKAVSLLSNAVGVAWSRPQPLQASLNAAGASLAQCQSDAGINQLEAFKHKVAAQVARHDPNLASQLIAEAQLIIDVLK